MAEKEFVKPVCIKCGENARPQALFCFACGGEIVEGADIADEVVSSEWFKEDIVKAEDTSKDQTTAGAEVEGENLPSAEGLEAETNDGKVEAPVMDRDTTQRPGSVNNKLRTASDLRRKPKPIRAKKIEVVWEDSNESPNLVFLVCGLLIFLIVCGIAALAMYYK
jgi:hypothetical protein